MNRVDLEKNQQSSFFLPEDALDFKKIATKLYQNIWIVLGVSFSTAFIAFLQTFSYVPMYQTSALLQVKKSSNSSIFSKLSMNANGDSALETQEALIRTRYILEPVIAENGLNISASPQYFPLIGSRIARMHSSEKLAKPFLGLKQYAWGGEKLLIQKLTPANTTASQNFRLVVREKNTFDFYSADGKFILKGKLGELLTGPGIQLKIDEMKARPGNVFFIHYSSPVNFTSSLSRKINIIDVAGNDPTQSTGLFELLLTDSDPQRAMNILNQIANYVVLKNREQSVKEAKNTLDFLQQRLAEIKAKLGSTENNINRYHSDNETLSIPMTNQLIINKLLRSEMDLEKLKLQKDALLQLYTTEHPNVIANENKINSLQKRMLELKEKVKKLPFINQQEINLQRDAKITVSAYLYLLNQQQQLEITEAGLSSNVAILSDAIPAFQLPSHKFFTVIAGFLLGLFSSVVFIIIRDALNKIVESSEQVENEFKIPVQVVLPFSRKQKQMEKLQSEGQRTLGTALSTQLILAKQEPNDITIESLRSLRVSLHVMSQHGSHVIAIMGSLSNIGKSFVSLNLTQIFADAKKKTILVDCDVRKGRLHTALNQNKSKGLGEYLENKYSYDEIIRPISDQFYFISCGIPDSHPIQLFQSERFKDLIQKLKQDFEQIILDTPPVIPVTDSIIIAQYCDVKLFVIGAGRDTIDDVKQAIKKVQSHQIQVDGFVLNHRKSLVPYGSRYYQRYGYGDSKTMTSL